MIEINHTLPSGNPRRRSNLATSQDPLTPDSRGPNGHPVTYNATGEKVELIPESDDESASELVIRRNDQAISDAYSELWDKVWWVRHHAHGEPEVGRAPAREVELHYGLDGLELTDFEWGLLCGRMSALAWTLGSNWDETLDT